MRIGILGGSFNPIHNGHINLALHAYEDCDLDQVWLMPSYLTPFKENQRMASSEERYRMCQLASERYPFLSVKDYEINNKSVSYTYMTLEELSKDNTHDEFFFIMGADSLMTFSDWKNPEIICKYSKLIVMNRDEYSQADLDKKAAEIKKEFAGEIIFVRCPKIDLSSTLIRKKISNNQDCSFLINEDVYQYILQQRLYSSF